MIREDKEALICDMAETYHIFNIFSYPARFIATLACGLKADSRIKTKMAGVNMLPPNSLLYALIIDELRVIRAWLTSAKEKPVFVSDIMQNGIPEKEFKGFDTAEDFDKWRKSIIERAK
jgi:hypothetical protein